MANTEKQPKGSGAGWSDGERFGYLLALFDATVASGAKIDYANAPRPEGRSAIACQRMIERLRASYKAELEAVKNGQSTANTSPGSKRKAKAAHEGDVDADGSPKKRGRGRPKKKTAAEIKAEAEANAESEMDPVKAEVMDGDDET
ncbi:hypothetical protein BS50DRAFT_590122 [Corynespora cassiicola Philippines]|uniref:Uncharacterized protein n=1 Tax=Corynespora cassiicola Philippines TaxID=1448308 RepID=A0A2T2NFR7_CORCC|nr:hypothetical protein BS50DRAFT_590122 [Corynespora cassiicola Philippines]